MAQKPIFCVTHPRACSTAFERVFMTRKDLACIHEPFGDAFYFGPERIGRRYEDDEVAREESGFAQTTYKTVVDRIETEGSEGQRVFIKDIIHYLLPPNGKPPQIAPSLVQKKRGIGTASNGNTNGHANGHVYSHSNGSVNGSRPTSRPVSRSASRPASPHERPFPYGTLAEPGNPTVLPRAILEKYHFTFLIRDPHFAIPSYYRCTIPPLDTITGFFQFYPEEAGYDEVRRVFDYLVTSGMVGPRLAGHSDDDGEDGDDGAATKASPQICVIDADDMLDNPAGMIKEYCEAVNLEYDPAMLRWADEENQAKAKHAFEKWKGFHEDAIDSTELKARKSRKAAKTEEEYDAEWAQKYGLKGANIIRQTVDANMPTYLYLKQFAIHV